MEGLKIAKLANDFRKQLSTLLDNSKGINYKSVLNFCNEINTLAGKNVFICEVEETTKHTYQIHNKLRYNDSYKAGKQIKIRFADSIYNAHTSDKYSAFNLASFMSEIVKNPFVFTSLIKSL